MVSTDLFSADFATIDSNIDRVQAQIVGLQAQLSELQDYRQHLLSVEQACESALNQFDTAIAMIRQVSKIHNADCMAKMSTLKKAVDTRFNEPALPLPPATDDNESGSTEPTTPPADPKPENTAVSAPESPIKPNVEPAIDVEVVATDTTTADTPIEPATDIETKLNKMSIQSIRKLAAAKGANGKGTRAEIAARLKTLVTESDLLAAS